MDFKDLNKQQQEAINSFSILTSASTYYQACVGDLRDNKEEWKYVGVKDYGVKGAIRCSNGHPIRYAHIARNSKGMEIVFGRNCIKEFFTLTNEQFKTIEKGFRETSKIVKEIYKMLEENDFKDMAENVKKFNLGKKFAEKEEDTKVKQIQILIDAKLPIPTTLVYAINSLYKRYEASERKREFENNNKSFCDLLMLYKLSGEENSIVEVMLDFYEKRGYLTDRQMVYMRNLILPEEKDDYCFKDIDTLLTQSITKREKDMLESFREQLASKHYLSFKQKQYINNKKNKYNIG